MIRKLVATLTLLVICLSLAACRQSAPAPSESDTSPSDVVQAFYDWYLSDREAGPKDVRNPQFLTGELIQEINRSYAAAGPGDPVINFVAAQDFPDSVTVGEAVVQAEQAVVPVHTSFGADLEINLKRVNGQWKIDGVRQV